MTIPEALKICEEELRKHKGGLQAYYEIIEILEDWFEEHEEEQDND